MKPEHSADDKPVIHVVSDNKKHLKKVSINRSTFKRPPMIAFMFVFALFGAYFIINSFAATSTLTKVWNSNSSWTTGSTLNQVSVANNAVSLAPASTTSVTPTTTSDLALNRPISASSVYQTGSKHNRTTYPAKYANDGISSTSWISSSSDPQSIYVDLGSQYSLSRVKLSWGGGYATSFAVQVSNDATNWSNVYSTTNGTGGVSDLSGLSGSGRYVRINGTARGGSGGYTLSSFEVYGSSSTSQQTNLALNKPATASSVNTDGSGVNLPSSYVDDGNNSTRWGSAYSDPQWITIDLGANYSIGEVKLNWETAYASSYLIEVSPDNSTWSTIYRTTTGDGGIDDLTGLSGSGRYVRMYGAARATQWGYSLYEMEVYGQTQATTNYYQNGSILLSYDGDAGTTATGPVSWSNLTASSTLPSGTGITYQARTSSDNTNWSSWTPVSGSLSGLSASRYIQIQANLTTNTATATPTLSSLTLAYVVTTADPAPGVSLTATPGNVTTGSSATLNWSSTSATSCTASGGWSGNEPVSGSASTGALNANTSYTLTCTGSGGSNSATTTVAATPATTSPSGQAVPIGDYTNPTTGQAWHQIFVDDFTIAAQTGSWGTTDSQKVVYTGDHGGKWNEYPDGWPATLTNGQPGYNPATVLSVHDGTLDFYLHSVNGNPQGANPAPILPSGSVYQTYGRYIARLRVPTPSTTGDYHAAWLLWPQDETKWDYGGESDFPETDLNSSYVNYYHHNAPGQQEQSAANNYQGPAIDLSQWHTFTEEWAPTYIKYYIDGTLIGTATNSVYQSTERWQLQTEYSGHNSGQSGHLLVDWVAVYSKQ